MKVLPSRSLKWAMMPPQICFSGFMGKTTPLADRSLYSARMSLVRKPTVLAIVFAIAFTGLNLHPSHAFALQLWRSMLGNMLHV